MGDIGTRTPFGRRAPGRPRVLLSLPNERWFHKLVTQKLLFIMLEENSRGRLDCDLIMPSLRPFENALHHIAMDFYEREYDYWISFDSDNPPRRNPLDLVFLDRAGEHKGKLDIVGCPTPVWHWLGLEREAPGNAPIYYNAYTRKGDEGYLPAKPTEGLAPVDAIGTGCFMIARRVFEEPRMRTGAFARKTDLQGRVERGNDISFCERARERGFQPWVHWGYPCHHFHELDLSEVCQAMNHWREGAVDG